MYHDHDHSEEARRWRRDNWWWRNDPHLRSGRALAIGLVVILLFIGWAIESAKPEKPKPQPQKTDQLRQAPVIKNQQPRQRMTDVAPTVRDTPAAPSHAAASQRTVFYGIVAAFHKAHGANAADIAATMADYLAQVDPQAIRVARYKNPRTGVDITLSAGPLRDDGVTRAFICAADAQGVFALSHARSVPSVEPGKYDITITSKVPDDYGYMAKLELMPEYGRSKTCDLAFRVLNQALNGSEELGTLRPHMRR